MRFPRWWFCFLLSGCSCFQLPWHSGYEYHRPVVVLQEEKHHHEKPQAMPRDVMVDVINDLGLKLLAIHNEDNENNIAISPYGALCVLIALSEGLQGEAAWEIHHAAQIPKDRSIIRVGLRDIHRHLKSYFIPEEGFLAGLTLNHDDVFLRPEYQEILKFYGYDYGTFNNALYPEPLTTVKPEITTVLIKTEDKTSETTMLPTTREESTIKSDKVTEILISTASITDKLVTTTELSTTSSLVSDTTIEDTSLEKTTQPALETTTTTETASTKTTTTTEPMESRTMSTSTEKKSTDEPDMSVTKSVTEILESTTTLTPTTTPEILTSSEKPTVKTQVPESTTQLSKETTTEQTTLKFSESPTTTVALVTTEASATTTLLPTTTLEETTTTAQPFPDTTIPPTLTPDVAFDPNNPMEFGNANAANQFRPNEPQFDEFNTQLPPEENTFAGTEPFFTTLPTDTTTQEVPSNMFEYPFYPDVNTALENGTNYGDPAQNFVENPPTPNQFVANNNKRNVKRKIRSVVDYLIARYYDDQYIHQSFDGIDVSHHKHPTHRGYVPEEPLSFLVYGKYREAKINFMRYDTVLPFHYVPHLNALALSFPLDSTKYYLLLLLPVEEDGIDQLICDLRLHGSLKYIIENLKLQRVVATIPSFTLKGYVILTPTFQKLGVQKVFEPRQSDFSPMTNETEIYVTNIEQAVTVTIRNYVDPSSEYNNKNILQYEPVHFKADHPFLYFVIDSELHVALMEGKVVNPLNSRIR